MKKIINTGLFSMFLLASQLSHAGEKTVIFTCEDQSKIVQYQHSVDIDSEVDYVTLRQGRKKTELYNT